MQIHICPLENMKLGCKLVEKNKNIMENKTGRNNNNKKSKTASGQTFQSRYSLFANDEKEDEKLSITE